MIADEVAFANLTWPEAEEAARRGAALILPVGSVEPHGPHLPLDTDVIIAEAMAERAAQILRTGGDEAWVLPSLPYAVTDFSAGFGGGVSVGPDAVTTILTDACAALARQGIKRIALANAHLEPRHLESLRAAVEAARRASGAGVVFPDLTSKRWARMLTEEFRSGACHAGQFETSIVLARRPAAVREEIRRGLPPNPLSLSRAIRDGAATFREAGGPQAYFGDPAAATAEEGRSTIETLATILATAIREGRSE